MEKKKRKKYIVSAGTIKYIASSRELWMIADCVLLRKGKRERKLKNHTLLYAHETSESECEFVNFTFR